MKVIYDDNTGKFFIKPDNYSPGATLLSDDKIIKRPASRVVYEGSLYECKNYIKTYDSLTKK